MEHAAWSWAFDTFDLGRAIRDARLRAGWQQAELAERLDVSRMTVSRLERGESVSVSTALGALTECGLAVVVVPKHARVRVDG